MITRPESPNSDPRFITHNLIRSQFRNTGAMKTPISVFLCPARRSTATISETYTSGSSSTEGICGDYGVNYGSGTSSTTGNDGAFRWNSGNDRGVKIAEITDGTSNTLLVGEKHVRPEDFGKYAMDDFCIYISLPWPTSGRKAGPNFPLALGTFDTPAGQFGSAHSGVVQFAFGDGRVVGLRTSIPGSTLGLLAARDDGQVLPSYD